MQTEYCMDCLAVIVEVRYDFVYLYDYSSSHTKKIGGGLNVTEMNNDWGGGVGPSGLLCWGIIRGFRDCARHVDAVRPEVIGRHLAPEVV